MIHHSNPFGAWQSWQPNEVAQLFSALAIPWWIAGGWAVDLFLGEQTGIMKILMYNFSGVISKIYALYSKGGMFRKRIRQHH